MFTNKNKEEQNHLVEDKSYVEGLMQGAVLKGYDPKNILESADIPFEAYTSTVVPLSGEELQRLILVLRNLMNDHYLGFLQVPGKLEMDSIAGSIAINEKTLGAAMRQMANFYNAVRSDEHLDLVLDKKDREATLSFKFSGLTPGVDSRLLYWFRMCWTYKFLCWLIGRKPTITRVSCSAKTSVRGLNYEEMFRHQVNFDQPMDSITFRLKDLRLPIVRSQIEWSRGHFLYKFPNWFGVAGGDHSISGKVQKMLFDAHSDGCSILTAKEVADQLDLLPRNLAQRLREERVTFQAIRSGVCLELAKGYLRQPEMPVSKVAEKMGFVELSDFTRSFRRWAGVTPTTYRRQVNQHYEALLGADEKISYEEMSNMLADIMEDKSIMKVPVKKKKNRKQRKPKLAACN
ncbi:AraC family transcriptional regulator [Oceanicoccus sagamiensis]|uniref:HTH araC/xylS-type domain-containing protein n=1 Tax=Oceanicoccus sagamiensis TaxID=716816 RepID=A0A1X9NEU7_9GAMM|nr:AraC family transcriptional regulator [Oceanicoccus sagamiensis]ARN76066.1 hypothetical protein BST96_19370 [Oceanicoccus sagamiensis]